MALVGNKLQNLVGDIQNWDVKSLIVFIQQSESTNTTKDGRDVSLSYRGVATKIEELSEI